MQDRVALSLMPRRAAMLLAISFGAISLFFRLSVFTELWLTL
jgi:hypothetical protein